MNHFTVYIFIHKAEASIRAYLGNDDNFIVQWH